MVLAKGREERYVKVFLSSQIRNKYFLRFKNEMFLFYARDAFLHSFLKCVHHFHVVLFLKRNDLVLSFDETLVLVSHWEHI